MSHNKDTFSQLDYFYNFINKDEVNYFIDSSIFQFDEKTIENGNVFHLISHGRPGHLLINGEWKNQKEVSKWLISNTSIIDYSSLHIYGCEFGKGRLGIRAVEYLESTLNISVAASDDVTGVDGDWDLEIGSVDASFEFSDYSYNLQCAGIAGGQNEGDDFDGDGICNIDDSDDDNDGIPDAIESPDCFPENTYISKVSPGITATITSDIAITNPNNIDDNDISTNGNFPFGSRSAGTVFFQFDFGAGNSFQFDEILFSEPEGGNSFVWGDTNFDIEASNDATTWDNVGNITLVNGNSQQYPISIPITTTTEYRYYRIVKNSGGNGSLPNAIGEVDFRFGGTIDQFQDFSCTDTDHFNLDSDGDGCSDAEEAFVAPANDLVDDGVLTNAKYDFTSPTNDADGNGLYDSSSFDDSEGYRTDGFCPDFDGDGVLDENDLDDDNDGILDADENTCTPVFTRDTVEIYENGVPGGSTSTSDHLYLAVNGDYGTLQMDAQGIDWNTQVDMEVVLAQEVNISSGFIFESHHDWGGENPEGIESFQSLKFYDKDDDLLYEIGPIDNSSTNPNASKITYYNSDPNSQDYSNPIAEDGIISSNNQIAVLIDQDLMDVKRYVLEDITPLGLNLGGGDLTVRELNVRSESFTGCFLDTDGDGIEDKFDLDSDGDGCSDAIEGGAAFTKGNTSHSGLPGGNSGPGYTGTASNPVDINLTGSNPTDVGPDGIPNAVDQTSGQGLGTSIDGVASDPNCCPITETPMIDGTMATAFCGQSIVDVTGYITNTDSNGRLAVFTTEMPSGIGEEIDGTMASNPGTYYFYFYNGNSDCFGFVSESLSLTNEPSPNAGTGTVRVECISSANSTTTFDLDDELMGEDTGGTWTTGSGPSIGTGNVVDFSGSAEGSYVYTYTLTGASPCIDDQETVTINIIPDTDNDGTCDADELPGEENDPCKPDPVAIPSGDCDGDGDPNGTDPAPQDPCEYSASQNASNAESAWATSDCDGDGDPNGTDPAPQDPCEYSASQNTSNADSAWATSDCDGDGDPNGTDPAPQNPCEYSASQNTSNAESAWATSDCDGDGDPNATDTDPQDPCSFSASQNPSNADSVWDSADCDGDGDPNATDTDSQDPCSFSASQNPSNADSVWDSADCDGDGDPNATDTDPQDPCSFSASQNPSNADSVWDSADCDGDGDPNATDTDPQDPCSFSASQNPSNADSVWDSADCDGDGDPNATDTDPQDPCSFSASQNPSNADSVWDSADCDGDGDPNATDTNPQDPCVYSASQNASNADSAWATADCDGDGDPNATDTNPQDPCEYSGFQNSSNADSAWESADCDGDGDPNGTDPAPQDPCEYSASQNASNAESAWATSDCDGDGDPNGTDPAPQDPCEYSASQNTSNAESAWATSDCDGDGDPNATDTDPQDPCSFSASQNPSNADSVWDSADCDGDGDPNATDTEPQDACVYSASQNASNANTAWNTSDCDGDGDPNGTDTNPQDACVYSTSQNASNADSAWATSDCDGDGDLNDTDTNPQDPCEYSASQDVTNADSAWANADCDGDGDLNYTDTAPQDPCEYSDSQLTANVSDEWKDSDCDNDGTSNDNDPDPLDPCIPLIENPTRDNSVDSIFCLNFSQNLNEFVSNLNANSSPDIIFTWSYSANPNDQSQFLGGSTISEIDTYYGFFRNNVTNCNSGIIEVNISNYETHITCPNPQVFEIDDNCSVPTPDIISLVTTQDDCGNISFSQSPAIGEPLSVGDHTITVSAVTYNNVSISCESQVTVIDTTDPNINCSEEYTVTLDNDCIATVPNLLDSLTISDNCTLNDNLFYNQNPTPGSQVNSGIGEINVVVSIIDEAGNFHQCDIIINVIDDSSPILMCNPPSNTLNVDGDCPIQIPDYRESILVEDNCTTNSSLSLVQSPAPGSELQGANSVETVSITAVDESGNTSFCTFDITLVDDTSPTIFCPSDQSLDLNNACEVTLIDYASLVSISNTCNTESSDFTVSQSPPTGTIYDNSQEAIEITMIITDINGNSSDCNFQVLINDSSAPDLSCPENTSLSLDENCQVALPDYTSNISVNDNCDTTNSGITITQFPVPGTVISGSDVPTLITINAVDNNGNSSVCSFTVVTIDNSPPISDCPENKNETVNESCEFEILDYRNELIINDNCSSNGNFTIQQNPVPGTKISINNSPQIIVFTVTDIVGNSSSCNLTVTLEDNIEPQLVCPDDQSIISNNQCNAIVPDYKGMVSMMDNCSSANELTYIQVPSAGTTIVVDELITVTVTDIAGNSNSCTFNLSILDESVPNVVCPTDINEEVNNDCSFILPDYTFMSSISDNCGSNPSSTTISQIPTPNTVFELSDSPINIEFTVTDQSGNQNNCSFEVYLSDPMTPILSCPSDQIILVDEACNITIPDFRTQVSVSDNCSEEGSITFIQNPSPNTVISQSDQQTIEIVIIAEDESGNSEQCTFDVEVLDEINPMITCPANLIREVDSSCSYILEDFTSIVSVTDNCSVDNQITIIQNPLPGTLFSLGIDQTITLLATDENGNMSTCSFEISLEDNITPTLICPSNVNVNVNDNCEFVIEDYSGMIQTSDNCTTDNNFSISQIPAPGTIIPNGVSQQEISFVINDESNNQSECSFFINLIDNNPPVISCPNNKNINLDSNCQISLEDYTTEVGINDNCSQLDGVTILQNPLPGTILSGHGTSQLVIMTATDESGNMSTCSFEVSLNDGLNPVFNCPSDQIIDVNGNCPTILLDYTNEITVNDNCNEETELVFSQSPSPGTPMAGNGFVQEVTLSVEDNQGNSSTCVFSIQLQDNESPSLNCPVYQELNLSADCEAILPDYTQGILIENECSNSDGVTFVQSPSPGTLITLNLERSIQVEIIASDDQGNSSTCNFSVDLIDNIEPTVQCPSTQFVEVDSNCEYTVPDYSQIINVTDNCTPFAELQFSQTPCVGCILEGPDISYTVILTVTDAFGNNTSCNIPIEVEDNSNPSIVCLTDQAINLDNQCQAVVPDYRDQISLMDNCNEIEDLIIIQTPSPGSTLEGVTIDQIVNLLVTDPSGNSNSCEFSLELKDTISPNITCPVDKQEIINYECAFYIPDYTPTLLTSDNCSSSSNIEITQSPAAGTVLFGNGFVQEIEFSVSDDSGNTSNCNFTITLIDDELPTITCPSNRDLVVDNACQAVIPSYFSLALVDDNCSDYSNLSVTQNIEPGTIVSGANTVIPIVLTVNDGNGNVENCSFDVTLKDQTLPEITCISNQSLNIGSNCQVSIPDFTEDVTFSDNCSETSSIVITQSPIVGTILSGLNTVTVVTITATDESGNSENCSFEVSLEDHIEPMVNCPEDFVVPTNDMCMAEIIDYRDQVSFSDNCYDNSELIITQSPIPGTSISGSSNITTLIFTVTDGSGNATNCEVNILLVDEVTPIVQCPEDIDISLNENCKYIIPDFSENITTNDNCTSSQHVTVTQFPEIGTVLEGHNTQQLIEITVDDNNGNTSNCTFYVHLNDDTEPEVNCPNDKEIFLDGNCGFQLEDYTSELILGDNCSQSNNLQIIQTPPSGTIFNGVQSNVEINFEVLDEAGNIQNCQFLIDFIDNRPPNPVICPENKELNVDDTCPVALPDYRSSVIFEDNCDSPEEHNITQQPAPGTILSGVGTVQHVVITIEDTKGNLGQCDFIVELVDNNPIIITCLADEYIYLDGNCSVEVEDYTDDVIVSNTCDIDLENYSISQSPSPGSILMEANIVQEVEITLTDNSGNVSMCNFNITLLDTIPPFFVCPNDMTLDMDDACLATVPDLVSHLELQDNCTLSSDIVITQSPTAGSQLAGPNSIFDVLITARDISGNITQCIVELMIQDNQAPSVDCPDNSNLNLDGACEYVIPNYIPQLEILDNCSNLNQITITQTPTIGSVVSFSNNIQVISFEIEDAVGNVSTCDFEVTIIDNEIPEIDCPSNQTIYLDETCSAVVPDFTTVDIFDNCTDLNSLTIVQNPAPGTILNGGPSFIQNVTIIATDAFENTATCNFSLNVTDNSSPTIACIEEVQILNLDENCEAVVPNYINGSIDISDNCTNFNDLTLTQNPLPGSVISGHNMTIEVLIDIEDQDGNSFQCTINHLTDDASAPEFDCPTDEFLHLGSSCQIVIPDYFAEIEISDNCSDGTNYIYSQTPVAGTVLAYDGNNINVNLSVTDASGESSSCDFEVEIIDNIPPSIVCPVNQNIFLDENCYVELPDYTESIIVSDNCNSYAAPIVEQNPISGTTFDQHGQEIPVTITVTDYHGNQSSCTFIVLIEDDIAPQPNFCYDNQTLSTNTNSCLGTIPDFTDNFGVTDNCVDNTDIIITQSPLPGTQYPHNTDDSITVRIRVEDGNGNYSDCIFNISFEDQEPPVAQCNDVTLILNPETAIATLEFVDVDNGSLDNCGIFDYQISKTNFDCSDIGVHSITLTIFDQAGNTAICNSEVTIDGVLVLPTAYAGEDMLVCSSENEINLLEVDILPSATKYGEVLWSTNGTGYFDDPYLLTPTYYASPVDIVSSGIQLYLDVKGNIGTCEGIAVARDSLMIQWDNSDFDSDGICDSADPCDCISQIFLGIDPSIEDPCSCKDNATNLINGQFDETITITTESLPNDQEVIWTVISADGLFMADSPNPPAAPIEIPFGTIVDPIAPGSHIYELHGIHVDSLGFTLTVQNQFGDLLSISNVCYYPTPTFVRPYPAAEQICLIEPEFELEADVEGVDGNGSFTVNGNPATHFDASLLGEGFHQIEYYFDADVSINNDPSDPGCTQTIFKTLEVVPTPTQVVCNSEISSSVDENCEILITPDILLEGDVICDYIFDISIHDIFGNPIPNPVPGSYVGQEVYATVTNNNSQTSCTTSVLISDNNAPVISCTNEIITLGCDEDYDNSSLKPTAVDNCDGLIEVTLVNESIDASNLCTGVEISRTYVAIDSYGNSSGPCTQTIIIDPVDEIQFPSDITFNCQDYSNNPHLTDPYIGGAGIPIVPQGEYCHFFVESRDDTVLGCGPGFHIIRTWTAINCCNTTLFTEDDFGNDNIQIVEVLDMNGPQIFIDDQVLSANNPGDSPYSCASNAYLPPALITDACVNIAEVKILTPVGTIFSNGGVIPSIGLPLGLSTVTYIATDECGNISQKEINVTVIDNLVPIPVCDEFTVVNLDSDGTVMVDAITFDDGSHDNCCLDQFSVARMYASYPVAEDFGPQIEFNCADINQGYQDVIMRVTDCYGNFNDCMVRVTVEDSEGPISNADVTDFSIDCNIYNQNLSEALELALINNDNDPDILKQYFGQPSYEDNCIVNPVSSWVLDIDECGQGSITRYWHATDNVDNSGPYIQQVITVTHTNQWNIQFPDDIIIECGNQLPHLGYPIITDDECETIAISHTDIVQTTENQGCFVIYRTYSAINWCTYDGITLNDDIQLDEATYADGGDGVVTYLQTIRVTDNNSPIWEEIDDLDVCIFGQNCAGIVELPIVHASDCSENLTYTASSVLGDGFGPFEGVTPGTYTVTYSAFDYCGNQSSTNFDVIVLDCTPPAPYCHSQLNIDLNPIDADGDGFPEQGIAEVWATDFDYGSIDNCTENEDLIFTISIDEDNFETSTTHLDVDCDNAGLNTIYLYVTDSEGNTQFCQSSLLVESAPSVCHSDEALSIAGNLSTQYGDAIAQATTQLSGSMIETRITEIAGDYLFDNLSYQGDYSVVPALDIDHANGVSTWDIVLIKQHILNINPFDNPYKHIAADVNKNGNVTTADIVQIRKLVLGNIDAFTNNTSWRFVDANFIFDAGSNPLQQQFPEVISFNNLANDFLNVDFIGVKIGDVSGNATANFHQSVEERSNPETLVFKAKTKDSYLSNEVVELKLDAQRDDVKGVQFSILFDTDHLEFIKTLDYVANQSNFGVIFVDHGLITFSWDQTNDERPALGLMFKTKSQGNIKDWIHLVDLPTSAEAYNRSGQILDIDFEYISSQSKFKFELYQNVPNPFTSLTTIGFQVPDDNDIQLTIYDIAGRILYRFGAYFPQGKHEIDIPASILHPGVMFYTLTDGEHSKTLKMIVK